MPPHSPAVSEGRSRHSAGGGEDRGPCDGFRPAQNEPAPAVTTAKLVWAVVGGTLSLALGLSMWGFTVDDALISIRYAENLHAGFGYRLNHDGPSTDGVTPLPWAFMIAALGSGSAWTTFIRTKALGIACFCLTGAVAAFHLGGGHKPGSHSSSGPSRAFAIETALIGVTLAVSPLPLAAYAASGMETPVAVLLATLATCVVRQRPQLAAVLGGLCAAFRPELVPWALAHVWCFSWASRRRPRQIALGTVCALLPFAFCVIARLVAFGRPAPLALYAKPSDLAHGCVYAAAGLFFSAAPIAALALLVPLARGHAGDADADRPSSDRRHALAGLLVFLGHALTVVVVGGDWMPFARLFAPALPSLAVAVATNPTHPWVRRLFSAAAFAVVGWAWWVHAPVGRSVMPARRALIDSAGPELGPVVACVDVGWVGAVRADIQLVDLAGVTDPEVAFLRGGHTSKRIDAGFLEARHVDTLLLLTADPRQAPPSGGLPKQLPLFGRMTDLYLGTDELIARHFEVKKFVPLPSRGAPLGGYLVLRRRQRMEDNP